MSAASSAGLCRRPPRSVDAHDARATQLAKRRTSKRSVGGVVRTLPALDTARYQPAVRGCATDKGRLTAWVIATGASLGVIAGAAATPTRDDITMTVHASAKNFVTGTPVVGLPSRRYLAQFGWKMAVEWLCVESAPPSVTIRRTVARRRVVEAAGVRHRRCRATAPYERRDDSERDEREQSAIDHQTTA